MGIVTLQMKHNASLIYLQNDGFWHQFNPLFHGSPLFTATDGFIIKVIGVQLLFDEGIMSCLDDVEITEITEILYPWIFLGQRQFTPSVTNNR